MARKTHTGTQPKGGKPRSVSEVLRPPSKKPRAVRQVWISRYEDELGLAPVATGSDVIREARCKFCSVFGREEEEKDTSSLRDLLAKPIRKKTKNVKIFTTFRRDNITAHMREQHPQKWQEYSLLQSDNRKAERLTFFSISRTIIPFLQGSDNVEIWIDGGIARIIRRLFLDDGGDGTSMDGFIEPADGGYKIDIPNRAQFETIIKCICTTGSYRAIAKLFVIFGEAIGNMKLGKPSEQTIRRCIRFLVAINLSAMKQIMARSWGYSILVDGATHESNGYFDVRIAFGVDGKIRNYHLLAIPTGDEAHSALAYTNLVLGVLTDLGEEMLLRTLIGITSDGAATMLGSRSGFAKRMQDACECAGGGGIVVNWCGSHQLNLVVNKMLKVFDDFVDFRSILGFEISFTRTHDSVAHSLGKCPTYATTRWESINETCKFLAKHYVSLLELQQEKARASSSPMWWLVLFFLADLTNPLRVCFRNMQFKEITSTGQ